METCVLSMKKKNSIIKITKEKKSHSRPSWNEYFTQICKVTATRSPCERLQVGCVIVKDNRIISQGYNGFLSGCPHESIVRDNHEQATIHAEQNALMDCAKRGVSCEGADIYITHFPCLICMRLICAGGIKKIYYIDDYKNDELTYMFSMLSGIQIKKINNS
jgi:dCMP deaminase